MLTGVTVTGADDEVDPQAMGELSEAFPFVEWGILMSATRAGQPRYPSRKWMVALENLAADRMRLAPLRLSAHFCGEIARAALAGKLHDQPVIERVQRIQVNGYEPRSPGVIEFARRMPCYEIVLQVRAEDRLQAAAHDAAWMNGRGSLLFDPSGGRGIESFKWPVPPNDVHLGYAGGIKPETVVDVVNDIYRDNGMLVGDFWIDMESGVRTSDRFDLGKVRQVLELMKPHVRGG